jgi:hypothetical protein
VSFARIHGHDVDVDELGFNGGSTMRHVARLLPLALIVLVVGCGGKHDDSAKIAKALGPSSLCQPTDFRLKPADGSQPRIYACTDTYGKAKCMIDANGIVRDVTVEVRALMVGAVGDRPSCI